MSGTDVLDPAAEQLLRRVNTGLLFILAACMVGATLMPMLRLHVPLGELTIRQVAQDLTLAPFFAATFLLLRCQRHRIGWPFLAQWEGLIVGVVALALVIACWCGELFLFEGYSLSRDEQMATFDAAVYGSGALFGTIPLGWRPFAEALNLTFILPIGDHEGWISSYLPINAALRAVEARVVGAPLVSPLFVALGFLVLWRISVRLWPASPASRWTALLLYAGSSQILFNGMTAFATSAHLALNLLWLSFFLRDGRVGRGVAIFVGWLATGLHQPLFHPLFAAPFFLILWRQARWRALVTYLIAYAAIAAFWLYWPIYISSLRPPSGMVVADGVSFLSRFAQLLHLPDLATFWLMASNLLRFTTWQHPLLLPFAAVGVLGSWRQPLVTPLLLGVLLLIVVVALLLPWQGHGWGYRYLHGLIGSLCLLAGYGCHWLEQREVGLRQAMLLTTLASVVIVAPVQAQMVRTSITPALAVDRQIAASRADIVVVDDIGTPFAQDLVVNRADLSNSPIRLVGARLRPDDMARLCRKGSLGFLDAPVLARLATLYGRPPATNASEHQHVLEAAARLARCRIMQID